MDRSSLGTRELEVLNYISEHAPISVGEVAEQFGAPLGLARTTVLVMMERLRQKGFLVRKKAPDRRAYQYMPRQEQAEVMRGVIRDFVDRTLRGSVSPFVAYLAEVDDLTEAEIAELQRLVQQLQNRKKDEE